MTTKPSNQLHLRARIYAFWMTHDVTLISCTAGRESCLCIVQGEVTG
jgi:hypothetical protein